MIVRNIVRRENRKQFVDHKTPSFHPHSISTRIYGACPLQSRKCLLFQQAGSEIVHKKNEYGFAGDPNLGYTSVQNSESSSGPSPVQERLTPDRSES